MNFGVGDGLKHTQQRKKKMKPAKKWVPAAHNTEKSFTKYEKEARRSTPTSSEHKSNSSSQQAPKNEKDSASNSSASASNQSTTTQAPKTYVRLKYEMCKNFREKGVCKYGDRCLFAHGDHELIKRGQIPNAAAPEKKDPEPVKTE